MSIKYKNLHAFKEGLILLCQCILETRRITHFHGSVHFTIPSNVNHVTDYNLGFLLLFNPLFIGFFGVMSILKNVEKSVNNLLIIDAG